MPSTNLSQLRATLEQLESYKLPEKYSNELAVHHDGDADADADPATASGIALDEEIVQRYQEARDEYLKRRMQQLFYEHLGTWDGSSFQMPSVPSEEEMKEMETQRSDVQQQLSETAVHVNRKMELLRAKHDAFLLRRQELGTMVSELEQNDNGYSQDDDSVADDNEDGDVDEEELAMQEEKIANLAQRKAELETQLQCIKAETAQTKKSLEETRLQIRTLSPTTVVLDNTISLEEVKSKIVDTRKRLTDLQDMSNWYDTIRSTMEELGGIKILGVESKESHQDCLQLKILLLGKHELLVEMTSMQTSSKRKRSARSEELRVSSATFVTPTLITAPFGNSGDNEAGDASNDNVFQMQIPPMDDLVRLGDAFGPIGDLQFLLREAIARIRAITSRVEELALLRSQYLTKIGKSWSFDYGYGGTDQELVCSLNEGIAVVLVLTPDCPVVDGSVYIDRIVGIGGWNQQRLDDLKESINMSVFRSPLALMDAIVQEVSRIEKEEGVTLPGTPCLPSRQKA